MTLPPHDEPASAVQLAAALAALGMYDGTNSADEHTAEGLQKLLGVVSDGQVPSMEAVREHITEMKAARQCLVDAIGNVDILLGILSGLTDLIGEN
ncbi:DUF6245 family protein [Streptosporangium sandarakinum]|uniref:DUF6245 family protein n=1 Tax=Streptosporangium sandarakinum TaxID=1260955 RepID=UPI0036848D32